MELWATQEKLVNKSAQLCGEALLDFISLYLICNDSDCAVGLGKA